MKELSGKQYKGVTIAVTSLTSKALALQIHTNEGKEFAMVEVDKNNIRNGTYMLFDENGDSVELGFYKNGVPHGKWQERFTQQDGRVVTYTTTFEKGIQNGEFTLKSEDGTLLINGRHVNGRKDGIWQFSSSDKTQQKTVTYVKGTRHGQYKNANNVMVVKGQYVDGKKDGLWAEYFPNGKVKKSCEMCNGQLNGAFAEFDSDGNVIERGIYKLGTLDKLHFKATTTEEGIEKVYANYDNGVLEGSYKKYFNDMLIKDGQYKNNKKDGEWSHYRKEDGKLHKHYMVQMGFLYGPYELYNDQGVLVENGNFVDDVHDGGRYFYYPDGKLKEFIQYKNGIQHGSTREYYEDGKLKTEAEYRDNLFVWKNGYSKQSGVLTNSSHEIENKENKGLYISMNPKERLHAFNQVTHEYEEGVTQIANREWSKMEFQNCMNILLLRDEEPITVEAIANRTARRLTNG